MKKQLKKQISINTVRLFVFIVAGILLTIFMQAPKAKAAAAQTIPSYWQKEDSDGTIKQRPGLECEWQQTDRIKCYGPLGDADRINYNLDVKKSAETGYLIFSPNGGNPSTNGYVALSKGSANDAYISTDYKNPAGGVDIINLTQDNIFQQRNSDKAKIIEQNCGTAEKQLKLGCLNGFDERPSNATEKELEKVKNIVGKLSSDAFNNCNTVPGLVIQYVVCPIIDLMTDGVVALIGGTSPNRGGEAREGLLITFLQIRPVSLNNTENAFVGLVQNMVNLANALFIIIFLVIIFSSSLPFGLDNYSIKKMLPKFILAVILTQFSLLICGLIVDFFNILGQAVPDIIFALAPPPGGFESNVGAAGQVITQGLGAIIGILSPFLVVLLLIMLLLALIGALIGFVYMIIRILLLYVLIILSPLAFVSMVLPGTEKFFKSWWKNFIRLNAMFVTITGMIALAVVLSASLQTSVPSLSVRTDSSDPGGTELILSLVSMLIPIAAFMLIPKTLKWTTQGLDGITGAVMKGAMGKGDAAGKWATGKAKGAAVTQKDKFAASQYGRGNKKIAAMLGGKLPTRAGVLEAKQKADELVEKNKKQRAAIMSGASNDMAGLEFDGSPAGRKKLEEDLAMRGIGGGARKKIISSMEAAHAEKMESALAELQKTNPAAKMEDVAPQTVSGGDAFKNELKNINMGGGSDLLGMSGGDEYAQMAAVDTLARLGDYKSIYESYKSGEPGSLNGKNMMKALEPHMGDAMTKAPDLIKGADGAFNNVSAEKFVQFDKDTMRRYIEHAKKNDDAKANLALIHAEFNRPGSTLGSRLDPTSRAELNDASLGVTF